MKYATVMPVNVSNDVTNDLGYELGAGVVIDLDNEDAVFVSFDESVARSWAEVSGYTLLPWTSAFKLSKNKWVTKRVIVVNED